MEVVRTPLCFTHEPGIYENSMKFPHKFSLDPAPDISKFPDAFSEDRDKLEAVFNSGIFHLSHCAMSTLVTRLSHVSFVINFYF